jgi:eukaryotic-like serine/threonine-protein kinase
MVDPILESLTKAVDGRYAILRELGRGGMGAVFLAQDLALDREVAIKVLPPEFAAQPALRERFVREAKLAASLSHPNIVHVHAVEEHGDLLAFVMQYVDGETLTERIARSGPYDPQDCARLLQDTAWALGYAHARGIVHRDVKPDNLLVERGTGRVMIMDFGIARQERATSLTEVGHSIGTPHYMSPEQAAAETVDGRSDLYSLGCVGFFAAVGRPPFESESAHRLLMQHLTVPAPIVTSVRAEFPDGLAKVIARTLEKEPAARFESGEAMAEAIGSLALRSREVAPLLRLFHQQTAQALQSVLMFVVIGAILIQLPGRSGTLLGTVLLVLLTTMVITVLAQVLDRVRFAVRQGFTVEDVEVAFAAMADETTRARDQLLSDPVERARIMRRKKLAIFGGAAGGSFIPVVAQKVFAVQAGRQVFSPLAGALLLAVTVLLGISIALWTMRPVRITLAQRVAGRIWSSRVGRALFARAARRYAAEIQRTK